MNYQNWFSGEPNDYPNDNVDGEENYGQFEFSDNLIKWNDMNLTFNAGQSYPLFEYKAQTQVDWYTVDDGVLNEITDATNSSEIVVALIRLPRMLFGLLQIVSFVSLNPLQ